MTGLVQITDALKLKAKSLKLDILTHMEYYFSDSIFYYFLSVSL